jgi:hypothetical protein
VSPLRPVLALGALLAGTGLLASLGGATSCVEIITWNGVDYIGAGKIAEEPALGSSLGSGVIPPCVGSDASGCEGEDEQPVALFRIPGVNPEIAVVVRPTASRVFLAPGYFPELAGHPLHDAIFGPRLGRPEEKRGFSCGRAFSIKAIVESPPAWGALFLVEVEESDRDVGRYDEGGGVAVFVDAGTEVEGLERNGLPFVEEGDHAAIEARECLGGGGAGKLVAARIASA